MRAGCARGNQDTAWSTEAEVERAKEAVGQLERNESISDEHGNALEAIIVSKERASPCLSRSSAPFDPGGLVGEGTG